MKTYKLSKSIVIFIFSILGFMTLFGCLIFIDQIVKSYSSGQAETWFLILWLCTLGWIWYAYLRIPFEIKVQSNNSIEFHSFLKRTVLSAHEIKSIKAVPLSIGFIDIRHTRGTIHLINQIDGFHDFISTVRSINPAIEIKGC